MLILISHTRTIVPPHFQIHPNNEVFERGLDGLIHLSDAVGPALNPHLKNLLMAVCGLTCFCVCVYVYTSISLYIYYVGKGPTVKTAIYQEHLPKEILGQRP